MPVTIEYLITFVAIIMMLSLAIIQVKPVLKKMRNETLVTENLIYPYEKGEWISIGGKVCKVIDGGVECYENKNAKYVL